MRKPLLITTAAVVVIAATVVLLWRPWQPRTTYLTDLVSSDITGYQEQAHDLVQAPSETGGSISYDLGGRFTTLETTVSLSGRPPGATIQIQIKLDGDVEYEAEVVAQEPGRPLKVTVTGAKKITLSGGPPSSLGTTLTWAEPRLS